MQKTHYSALLLFSVDLIEIIPERQTWDSHSGVKEDLLLFWMLRRLDWYRVTDVWTKRTAFIVSIGILIYIQQDATLHNLFYLETALHVSGGTSTHYQ